ncbi:hypothetical protein WJX81_008460 [Elliptochloris bilobata]|uniref:Uncharacterized protein n=1 Tax=Elliptochloris bilobata TaxID=381761 RepID=A0AAW1QI26_9CHLO
MDAPAVSRVATAAAVPPGLQAGTGVRGRSATLHLGEMVVFHRALAADGAVVERTFGGASAAAGTNRGAVQEDARPTLPTAATGPAGTHESAASPQAARTAAIRGPSPALAADEANVSREEFDAHEESASPDRESAEPLSPPSDHAEERMQGDGTTDEDMAYLVGNDEVPEGLTPGVKYWTARELFGDGAPDMVVLDHPLVGSGTWCRLVGSDPPYERWTDRRLKHAQVPDIHTFDRLVFVVHVPMHYIVVVVGPGERGIVCYDLYAGGGSPYGGKHYQGAVQSVQRFVRAELSRAKGSDEGLYDIRFAAFREKGTFDEDG